MNDNDIIKALECCMYVSDSCFECPFFNMLNCALRLKKSALALINRQKAEIESLKLINSTYCAETKIIRDIAFREFAEKLKETARMPLGTLYGKMVYEKDIDNLVKEMTEGEDDRT